MTMNSQRESATIYQFPARGRFATAIQGTDWRGQSIPTMPRIAHAALSGAWYHDEAIREADEPRKN